jgi:hypothetical protein
MRSLAHQICAFRDFPCGRFHLVPQLRHARFRLGIEIKIPGDFAEFWLRPLEAFDRVVVPFGLLNSFVLFALTHWFRSAFQTSPLSIVQRSVFRSGGPWRRNSRTRRSSSRFFIAGKRDFVLSFPSGWLEQMDRLISDLRGKVIV